MSANSLTPTAIHNAACEQAAQADCHCHCHGAGHQFDLIQRAAKCATQADEDGLVNDLEAIFGGFHTTIRDVNTPTRTSRTHLSSGEAATLKISAGKGATWAETLLLDEAVHAAFLDAARTSRSGSDMDRIARENFVTRVTRKSINVVESKVASNAIENAHVWCSIVAEFADSLQPAAGSHTRTLQYDQICYPRVTREKTPPHLPAVRNAGLQHLASEYNAANNLSTSDKIQLLRLVGMATCADPWHHPAIVRNCIQPLVVSPNWPPTGTTTIAVMPYFRTLSVRWTRKRHW